MKHIKILLLVMLISASSQIWAQKSTKYDSKVVWTTIFKDYATFSCICEITNDEILASLVKHKDISFGATRDLLHDQEESADSAGRNFAKRIPVVSTEKESDYYNHKSLMSSCLKFTRSTELDSIASKQYDIFMKTYADEWLDYIHRLNSQNP